MNTMNQKYTRLAYEVKNIVKTSNVERIYLNIKNEQISQEPFQGWNEIIFSQDITNYCMKYDISLDSDKLIDLVTDHIIRIERNV